MSTEELNLNVGDKEKQHRTSPRTKAFYEVIAVIGAYIADEQKAFEEQSAAINDADLDQDERQALQTSHGEFGIAINTALDIKARIESMIGTQSQKPAYAGRHYIGVREDGSRECFMCQNRPTRASHGIQSDHKFSIAYGPFRTEEGAAYRMTHFEDAPKSATDMLKAVF